MKLDRLVTGIVAGALSMAAAGVLSAAAAVPLPGLPAAPVAPERSAPVELAHGCHRGIQRDYHGWHFHTGACVRRNTAPPGLRDTPYRRYYRSPLCSYQCRHVGPVKQCQQVCR